MRSVLLPCLFIILSWGLIFADDISPALYSGVDQPDVSVQQTTHGKQPSGSKTQTVPGTESKGSETQAAPGTEAAGSETQAAPGTEATGSETQAAPGTEATGSETQEAPRTEAAGSETQAAPGTEAAGSETQAASGTETTASETQTAPGTETTGSETQVASSADVTGAETKEEQTTDVTGSETQTEQQTETQPKANAKQTKVKQEKVTAEQTAISQSEKGGKTKQKAKKKKKSKSKLKHKKHKRKKKTKPLPVIAGITMTDDVFSFNDGTLGNVKSLHDIMIWGISASSTYKPEFDAKNIDDNNLNTAWIPKPKKSIGQYIVFKMDELYFAPIFEKKKKKIKWTGFLILNGFAKDKETWRSYSRVKKMQILLNGKPIYNVKLHDTMNWQRIKLPHRIMIKPWDVIKAKITDIYDTWRWRDERAAITEFILDGGY